MSERRYLLSRHGDCLSSILTFSPFPRCLFLLSRMEVRKDAIERARVLLVGAGGVGSEVLKGLALMGFRKVEVVDLDVIELTNLNRQLLYRRCDIGRLKAEVAQEAVRKIGSGKLKIVSHCVDVRSGQFNTRWFCGFDCVIGTLDNLGSRQHLNMMCLASGVPLIESGTEGYKGQVTVHLAGRTACYDCDSKPATRQSYPVCTIRSRPTESVHCVVWAREYLFEAIFGEGDTEDDSGLSAACATKDPEEFIKAVFSRVFGDDIAENVRLGNVTATPLYWGTVQGKAPKDRYSPTGIWTLEENIFVFEETTRKLLGLQSENGGKLLVFDKDDDVALDFVTSASNIRAYIFKIDPVARFTAKQMAARVVPATSTTNAIVSGLIILQLLSVINATNLPSRNAWVSPACVVPEIPSTPRTDCAICSTKYFSLSANIHLLTLQTILHISLAVLPGASVSAEKDVTITHNLRLLYDVDFTDNLAAPLSSLNINHSDRLHIIISPNHTLVFEILNNPKHTSGTAFKILPCNSHKRL